MLRACVIEGFDDDELVRAYKLLILTYLFEDYQEMAEFTMLKFLKKFPEYELKAIDQVEFKYLYNSYQTVPVYSIGVIAGVNYSFVRIIQPYSTSSESEYSGEYSVSGVGYQFGFQFKRYINEKIDINLDLIYVNKQYDYSISQYGYNLIEYKETQSILSFPLSGTYDFKYKIFYPYLRIGASLDYMIGASIAPNRSFIDVIDKEPITGSDILKNRNELNISALIGAGVKYKIKNGYVMLDLRYNFGLTNNVNGENRYKNGEETFGYQYVDDDFSINNFYMSLGYVYSFYKTKGAKGKYLKF